MKKLTKEVSSAQEEQPCSDTMLEKLWIAKNMNSLFKNGRDNQLVIESSQQNNLHNHLNLERLSGCEIDTIIRIKLRTD